MKKAVSYSLFGYGREKHKDCFDFHSYLRSMHICIRFNRILYSGWENVINMDEATYNSPYKKIFDWHQERGFIKIKLWPNNTPLCAAMLWRIATVFDYDHPSWRYSHVICRDLDSISTYREAQMVKQWIDEDKAIHCITDSVSHDIAMLGGLCGFRPGYVNDALKLTDNPSHVFEKLMERGAGIDFNVKGSDQKFLNDFVYNTSLAYSATEHFLLGRFRDRKEENGRHYSIDESIDIGVPEFFKATNLLAGHCGAAGFYEIPTLRLLNRYDPYEKDYVDLETLPEYAQIFYWRTREDLK
jgi:hypothetical protein